MSYSKRPFGVGILLGGYDSAGTHLFETIPSGEYYEYYAQAIGARSQSARTYLEKNVDQFKNCSLEDLIKHGVKALRASAQEIELNSKNVSVGIVGVDTEFTKLSEEKLQTYLQEEAAGDVEMVQV